MNDLTPKVEQRLLPCPFCGGEAEHIYYAFLGDHSMASCRTCGASAYNRKWNTRADLQSELTAAKARIAELEQILPRTTE